VWDKKLKNACHHWLKIVVCTKNPFQIAAMKSLQNDLRLHDKAKLYPD
jgi:hypothetical protein